MSPIPHINFFFLNCSNGDFLAVQLLRLRVSNEGGTGSIPGRVTKIPHATWPKTKKQKKNPKHNSNRISKRSLCIYFKVCVAMHTLKYIDRGLLYILWLII